MSDGEKEGFGRKVASSTAVALATQAVVFVGTALIGWLSGSFALVWEFALANPGECAVSCLMALLVGGFIGQYARLRWMRRKGVTAESVKALKEKVAAFESLYGDERAQITSDLTCCDFPGMLLVAQLYCDGFTMAKGDLAEANDPVWLAGIVTTGRVEVDGIVSYRLDLAPERRSLYARHERFFLEEVKRIGKGRVDVDFDGVRVKLHLSAREQ